MLDDVLTARIEAAKRMATRQAVYFRKSSGGVPSGDRDERGRVTITYTTLDAFIEQRPSLDRGAISTESDPTTRC